MNRSLIPKSAGCDASTPHLIRQTEGSAKGSLDQVVLSGHEACRTDGRIDPTGNVVNPAFLDVKKIRAGQQEPRLDLLQKLRRQIFPKQRESRADLHQEDRLIESLRRDLSISRRPGMTSMFAEPIPVLCIETDHSLKIRQILFLPRNPVQHRRTKCRHHRVVSIQIYPGAIIFRPLHNLSAVRATMMMWILRIDLQETSAFRTEIRMSPSTFHFRIILKVLHKITHRLPHLFDELFSFFLRSPSLKSLYIIDPFHHPFLLCHRL